MAAVNPTKIVLILGNHSTHSKHTAIRQLAKKVNKTQIVTQSKKI